jgi:hypothetical protein
LVLSNIDFNRKIVFAMDMERYIVVVREEFPLLLIIKPKKMGYKSTWLLSMGPIKK